MKSSSKAFASPKVEASLTAWTIRRSISKSVNVDAVSAANFLEDQRSPASPLQRAINLFHCGRFVFPRREIVTIFLNKIDKVILDGPEVVVDGDSGLTNILAFLSKLLGRRLDPLKILSTLLDPPGKENTTPSSWMLFSRWKSGGVSVAHLPGRRAAARAGTCSRDSGKPEDVEANAGGVQVVYSNIKFGDINSTFNNNGGGGGNPSPNTTRPNLPAQTMWGQCGGQGWTGPTACQSPFTCHVINEFYSQCF
nr:putative endoglucanase [synthetic construct]